MRRLLIASAVVLLGVIPARAEITGIRIAKDETVSVGGTTVRHVAGAVLGKAERNEPGVPTLDKVAGLKYESDFESVAAGRRRQRAVLVLGAQPRQRHGRTCATASSAAAAATAGVPGRPETWPRPGRS